MRHHLSGEEVHGAQSLVVLHAGEGEITPEIVDALLCFLRVYPQRP
jgi:hypothetical protein